jgi:hypothetical protein
MASSMGPIRSEPQNQSDTSAKSSVDHTKSWKGHSITVSTDKPGLGSRLLSFLGIKKNKRQATLDGRATAKPTGEPNTITSVVTKAHFIEMNSNDPVDSSIYDTGSVSSTLEDYHSETEADNHTVQKQLDKQVEHQSAKPFVRPTLQNRALPKIPSKKDSPEDLSEIPPEEPAPLPPRGREISEKLRNKPLPMPPKKPLSSLPQRTRAVGKPPPVDFAENIKKNAQRKIQRLEAEKSDPVRGLNTPIEGRAERTRNNEKLLSETIKGHKLRASFKNEGKVDQKIFFERKSSKDLQGKSPISADTAKKLLEQLKNDFNLIFGGKIPENLPEGSLDRNRYESFKQILNHLEKHEWFQNTIGKPDNSSLNDEYIKLKALIASKYDQNNNKK